ncbi:MAG: tryptophan-rich sensory protein [Flavobacteriales bacterium]|nr:tryptophan-rich sensory protein [Flavobacteriales bacterium]
MDKYYVISFYMLVLIHEVNTRAISILATLFCLLNLSWNPIFFRFHWVELGFIILIALLINILLFFLVYWKLLKGKS